MFAWVFVILTDLTEDSGVHIVGVVVVRVLSRDTMDQRIAIGPCFYVDGVETKAVRLHLVGKKGPHLPDRPLYRVLHGGGKRTVIGNEVNHPHRAGFAPCSG